MNGLLATVAQNIKLTLAISENIYTVDKVYGGSYEFKNNSLQVNVGILICEELHPVLIKLKLKNIAKTNLTFKATAEYNDAIRGALKTITKDFELSYMEDGVNMGKTRNDYVCNAIKAYELNDIMEVAIKEMEKGNTDVAKIYLDTIHSSKFSSFLSDSVKYPTNGAIIQTYHWNSVNNATFKSKTVEDQKLYLKKSRSENYQIRTKGVIKK